MLQNISIVRNYIKIEQYNLFLSQLSAKSDILNDVFNALGKKMPCVEILKIGLKLKNGLNQEIHSKVSLLFFNILKSSKFLKSFSISMY